MTIMLHHHREYDDEENKHIPTPPNAYPTSHWAINANQNNTDWPNQWTVRKIFEILGPNRDIEIITTLFQTKQMSCRLNKTGRILPILNWCRNANWKFFITIQLVYIEVTTVQKLFRKSGYACALNRYIIESRNRKLYNTTGYNNYLQCFCCCR